MSRVVTYNVRKAALGSLEVIFQAHDWGSAGDKFSGHFPLDLRGATAREPEADVLQWDWRFWARKDQNGTRMPARNQARTGASSTLAGNSPVTVALAK
jgi:hypothetical protein